MYQEMLDFKFIPDFDFEKCHHLIDMVLSDHKTCTNYQFCSLWNSKNTIKLIKPNEKYLLVILVIYFVIF